MPFDFFFSYARDDWKGNYLKIFFDDLTEQVRFVTGHPVEEVGFRDVKGIEFGSNWPDELAAALATCRSFVPVYTPTYFTRPYCGREWWVFDSRIEQYLREKPGRPPGLILPVMWCAARHLPSDLRREIQEIQYAQEDFGELYCKEGLLQLMKGGRKYKKTYDAFIDKFAEKLKAASKLWELPPLPRYALSKVDNYFEVKTARSKADLTNGSSNSKGVEVSCLYSAGPEVRTTVVAGGGPPGMYRAGQDTLPPPLVDAGKGPRYAHFIFVAASKGEFSTGSHPRDLRAYEDDVAFWKPFLPPKEDTVYSIVTYMARRLNFRPIDISLDTDIDVLIERAKAQETVVIIVIDPWTLLLPRYAEIMRRCDSVDAHNYAILVAWNRQDPHTNTHAQVLMKELRGTFTSKWSNKPTNFYHDVVDSLDTFNSVLTGALNRAQNNILEARGFVRDIPRGGPSELPIVSAAEPR